VAKPTPSPGLLHGEAQKPTFPPGLLHGEVQKPTTPPGLLHGEVQKPTLPPGLLRGEVQKPTTAVAFVFDPVGGQKGRLSGGFLYTREKASCYEKATKGDFFVAGSSPLVNLLFCQRRAKLWLRRGKTPPPNPAAPRGAPYDRDRLPARPQPARGLAPATRPSQPAREGSLGAPNDRPFPLGARRKARNGKAKRKEEPPMARPPPLCPRPVSHDHSA